MSVQERAERQLKIFSDVKPLTFRLHGKAHSNTHTHTHQRNLRNDECCKTTWPITCLLIGGLISRLIRPIRVMCCCCLKSESVLQTCKGEYCLLSLPCERSQTHLTEIEISFLKIQKEMPPPPPHHHQCLVFSVWWRSKMLHQLPLQT